ncbi:hypothetical protein E2320_012236, partial [Naja naja]
SRRERQGTNEINKLQEPCFSRQCPGNNVP